VVRHGRDLGHDLGFGIGIAHGFATLGTIGFEGRFDYAAIGTVSNVASRLCDEAKPGQILVSPRVRLAVDKAVLVEPVGEFTLKGIRRPMMTYNVLESELMSAFGTKRTLPPCRTMSAFGGKADMKRTWRDVHL
jgi:class 3 adenylate cyclase